MKTLANILRYFLVTILYIVLLGLIIILPIVFSLSHRITNRAFVKDLLNRNEIYKDVPQALLPTEAKNSELLNNFLKDYINDQSVSDEVKKIVENGIDQTYDQLEAGKQEVTLKLDTASIKKLVLISYLKNYVLTHKTGLNTLTVIKCTNEVIARYDKTCPKELTDLNKQLDSWISKIGPQDGIHLFNTQTKNINIIKSINNLPWILSCALIGDALLIILLTTRKYTHLIVVNGIILFISLINFTISILIRENITAFNKYLEINAGDLSPIIIRTLKDITVDIANGTHPSIYIMVGVSLLIIIATVIYGNIKAKQV